MYDSISESQVSRQNIRQYVRVLAAAAAGVLLLLLSGSVIAQGFARGYATKDTELKPGMVVALNTTDNSGGTVVERATRENIEKIIGVATEIDDNLVTITGDKNQIYVQSSGTVLAFVSDINGVVNKDDSLALSPLKGVLMRADETTATFGRALEDFRSEKVESQNVQTGDEQKLVKTAKMPITIEKSLIVAPQAPQESELQRFGRSIAGQGVSDLQVIVAMIIFLLVLVTEGSIIYGAVSSGIVSLGRNPLAQRVIKGELIRVFGVVVLVLCIGLGAVYAVLRI